MTHLTFNPVSPGTNAILAVRATDAALDQIRLDGGLVSPYDEHSGAPASLGRAPSRSRAKGFGEGALARSDRAHADAPVHSRQTHPRLNPVLSDRGAATAVTKPCSRSAAANGPALLKQRGAQHLLPHVDAWLCKLFAPERIEETASEIVQADAQGHREDPAVTRARKTLTECERKLAKHLDGLEAGIPADVIAARIEATQREKSAAESVLATTPPGAGGAHARAGDGNSDGSP